MAKLALPLKAAQTMGVSHVRWNIAVNKPEDIIENIDHEVDFYKRNANQICTNRLKCFFQLLNFNF